jgi:hypothetical protein
MARCSQCKTETQLHAAIPVCHACVDTPLLYFVVCIAGRHTVMESTPSQIYAQVKAEPALLNCLDDFPFATRAEAEYRRNSLNAPRMGVRKSA